MSTKPGTLRRRLARLVVCIVGVAITPVAGVLAWRDGEREVALETARLDAAARVVASLAADAAASRDVQGAFHALRSIATMKDVDYGRIEAPPGRLLVETGAGVRLVNDVREGRGRTHGSIVQQLVSQSSEVSVPIAYGGNAVGRIVLLGRTEGLLLRFLVSLGKSLAVAIAAVLVGLAIAWRLQERIARPILALTQAMHGVQESHDFSRGVSIAADGEVETLVAGFNRMLAEIQVRDDRIAEQMAGLEGEVAARTAELVVARDAAEAANTAKSEFLATMSHEIRTPMHGVMAMAELLAGSQLPPRERRFAEVIVNSGAGLLTIINDILDFSKIEAGKLELESVRVELGDIVDDVLSLFWDRALGKGLDFAGYVDPKAPAAIAGDPVRLRQVIANLVNNAIKFTESGGVFVEIAAIPEGGVRIVVEDTGIGIPADKLDTVFGAFSQADQSTTRSFGGTGLGLAICKRLVDAMDGRIGVASEPGKGSRFVVEFTPPATEPAAEWPQAAAPGLGAVVAHGGPFTRRALGAYLECAGYRLSAAPGAALAIGSPAGLQALPALPPLAICLGTIGDSQAQELLGRGVVQAVLPQPVRRQDLLALLRRIEHGDPLQPVPDSVAVEDDGHLLPQFAGRRVLVADDSAVNREVAFEALRRLGVEARLVATGAAAVAAADEENFDALLMDGSMPEMDGYAAAREIRRREQATGRTRLPVVALTAHVIGPAAEEWRRAGMDGVLHKPFTLTALAQALGRVLPLATEASLAGLVRVDPPTVQPSRPHLRGDLLDLEAVAELEEHAANGRPDFVERVIRLYEGAAPQRAAELQAAVRSSDADSVAAAAHALKSMSHTIGAKAVATVAGELEIMSLDGTMPDDPMLDGLAGLLTETLAALEDASAWIRARQPE